MEIEWPGDDAPESEMIKYLKAMHACEEEHAKRQILAASAVSNQVGRASNVNIVGIAAIVLTMLGSVVTVSRWTGSVSTKLDAVAQIVADGKLRDEKIAAIDARLAALQAVGDENQTALIGAKKVR